MGEENVAEVEITDTSEPFVNEGVLISERVSVTLSADDENLANVDGFGRCVREENGDAISSKHSIHLPSDVLIVPNSGREVTDLEHL